MKIYEWVREIKIRNIRTKIRKEFIYLISNHKDLSKIFFPKRFFKMKPVNWYSFMICNWWHIQIAAIGCNYNYFIP